jgi:hypothetical protein
MIVLMRKSKMCYNEQNFECVQYKKIEKKTVNFFKFLFLIVMMILKGKSKLCYNKEIFENDVPPEIGIVCNSNL